MNEVLFAGLAVFIMFMYAWRITVSFQRIAGRRVRWRDLV